MLLGVCISNKEINELGKGIVLAYLKRSNDNKIPKYVDIEGIAASLGLNIAFEHFALGDCDKIGFLADGSTPLKVWRSPHTVSAVFPLGMIVLDDSLKADSEKGKMRFTVAHEVAHFVLERHINEPQYKREFNAESRFTPEEAKKRFNLLEMQADKLAAAILMPDFIIAEAIKDLNNSKKIVIYGENTVAAQERETLTNMALRIGVSYSALFIRLRQFNLFEYHPICEYVGSILEGLSNDT